MEKEGLKVDDAKLELEVRDDENGVLVFVLNNDVEGALLALVPNKFVVC